MHRFGEFEVDGLARELRRGGVPVHLEPQAFDLLLFLLEHRHRVVPKVELLDGVWGHRFSSDANLTTRIKEVRRAVGDDGRAQRTIRNERGRGYRFVAPLAPVGSATDGAAIVGRREELAAVAAALGRSRLVTLVGPGGVGKSTLARHAAASSPAATGVHLVELAGIGEGAPVLPAVARALDVEHDEARPDDAVRSIARLDALLVLDNCEHVLDHATDLVARLLAVPGAPLRILATSQVPLGPSEEVVVAVGPLDLADASELFGHRARAALPQWDDVGTERVEALVARLDRLPLAIEMAAARVRSVAFEELERMVVAEQGLLQVTHRAPAPRHRSLRSLVGWSADLLDPHHRALLTGFSVFAGEVTAADAGAVLAPDEPAGVVFDLAALAERSLLVADVTGPETRYSMLSAVRAVTAGWLEGSGRAPALRQRHAEHVVDVLRQVDLALRTPEEGTARRRLDGVVAEVRAAHAWARRHDPALASAASGALSLGAYATLWHEPAVWSRALLADHGHDAERFPGAVLAAAGAAAHRSDLAEARAAASAVVAATAASEPRLAIGALELLADVSLYQGDLAGATDAAEALGRLGVELGDRHATTVAVVDAALVRAYGGAPAGALELLDAADRTGLAPSDAAWLAYARGEVLHARGGRGADAAFTEAIDLGRSVGNRYVASVAQVSLAVEHARSGATRAALDGYAGALADFLRHGNVAHAVTAIRNLVGLLRSIGDDRGVAVLAGAVADPQLQASYGTEAEQVRDAVDEVRRRVGAERFDGWFEEGRARGADRIELAAALVDDHRR